MGIIISFCITVYNQSDLVKKCIESIIPYKGKNIEIIISDDRSTEDVRSLVENYHDERIKYFLNEENLGHDRNILSAISRASGKYAFLMRTRDMIIPSAIPTLIECARSDNFSYISGGALNEEGKIKIQYTKDYYKCGEEAVEANYKLFIHPSGNMYRVADIRIDELRSFLAEESVSKSGFIVHSLIRLKLATTGDFKLIQEPAWIYTDTENAKDRAVNHSQNGIGVYAPVLIENRYQCEMKWARKILPTDIYIKAYYLATALYLDLVTWGFKITNSDKRVQRHYDYKKMKFSVSDERRKFRTISESFYDKQLGIDREQFMKELDKIFWRNRTQDALKYIVRASVNGTPLYHAASRIYKKYIKKL